MLLKLRDRLLADRGVQLSNAAELIEPHGTSIADAATDEFDHDLALSHLSAEQDALYEVEEALRRIAAGTYGRCEETGRRIPAARLQAIPWARFSREAQARYERSAPGFRERLSAPASVRDSAEDAFKDAETGEEQPEPASPEDNAVRNVSAPSSPAHRTKKQRRVARPRR